jgi:hypothetical protein
VDNGDSGAVEKAPQLRFSRDPNFFSLPTPPIHPS